MRFAHPTMKHQITLKDITREKRLKICDELDRLNIEFVWITDNMSLGYPKLEDVIFCFDDVFDAAALKIEYI